MKIAAVFLLATLIPLTGAGNSGPPTVATVGYTGPGDVVSGAVAWYSCQRAYNAAYAAGANAGCNLMRASDSHTCDVLIAASGTWGNTANCGTGADNGQTASAFCNSTTCSVTKAYDQTGTTGNISQATAADQPAITFSCVGVTACMSISGNAQNLSGGSLAGYTNPISASSVSKFDGSSGQAVILADSTSSDPQFYYSSSTTAAIFQGYSTSATYTTNTVAARNDLANATGLTSVINLNGTETTASGTTGTAGLTAASAVKVFRDNFGNNGFDLSVSEAGYWSIGFSSGNRTSLCRNQQSYYGATNFGATC